MSFPATYAAFRRTAGGPPRTIEPSTEILQMDLSSHEVLIKIHAVSLNFRDVGMLHGRYPVEVEDRGIPCSDCAAEVVKTGPAVEGITVGDHVSPICDLGNLTGNDDTSINALGGDTAGVLVNTLSMKTVKIPEYLSWEEGSTLACAGLTAWTALDALPESSRTGSALLQGTGGVSMFAVLLCEAAGLQSIITSSSDAKIESIKKLGSRVEGINYKTTPDQAAEVQRLTNGRGVDFVINTSGPGSIPHDIGVLRKRGGTVSLVGFLAGVTSRGADMSIATEQKYGTVTPRRVARLAWQKGLFIYPTKAAIRVHMALTISDEELEKGLSILTNVMDEIESYGDIPGSTHPPDDAKHGGY